MLWQITLPYVCYGIVSKDEVIVEAAPIARWVEGKPLEDFARWVASKGGSLEQVAG
jgi:hypothetical protein